MPYPTISPEIFTVSKNCLDIAHLDLWALEDVLGLETAAYLPGNLRSSNAHSLAHFRIWINDNGTPKSLELGTFVDQFPSYSTAAIKAITECQPWPFGEVMNDNLGLTAYGDNSAVIILFTPEGVIGWHEDLEIMLDDYLYYAKNGFEDEEDAEDALSESILSPGKICSLFKTVNLSAHETFAMAEKHKSLLERWKFIAPALNENLLTKLNWSL